MCVSAPTDHDRPASGYRAPLEFAIPPGHRPTCPRARVHTAIPLSARAIGRQRWNQWDTGMVTQDRIFDRHELPGGRVTREESR